MFGRRQQQYGGGYGRSPMGGGSRRGGRFKLMLIIGLAIAGFHFLKYFTATQVNPITGEKQHVSLTPEQEVALGLQSAPHMVQQHGGLHPDQRAQGYVKDVGRKLVESTVARQSGYEYGFHLLADPNVINAFALPGGQVFITEALFAKLTTEDQLAGILGHEVGHVIHRHGAERLAKQGLTQGLITSVMVGSGDASATQMAQAIGSMVNMKYGREQELESDDFGVRMMMEAGYDPRSLLEVMDILEDAAGPNRTPEHLSTHPNPDNRREMIMDAMEKYSRG